MLEEELCALLLGPPGPGLPGPVTADFPCLNGRLASGWGQGGLQSLCMAPVRPPWLSTLDLALGWIQVLAPNVSLHSPPSVVPSRSGRAPKRSPGGRGPHSCLVVNGWPGVHMDFAAPALGQMGEGLELRPCQSSAQSCAEEVGGRG